MTLKKEIEYLKRGTVDAYKSKNSFVANESVRNRLSVKKEENGVYDLFGKIPIGCLSRRKADKNELNSFQTKLKSMLSKKKLKEVESCKKLEVNLLEKIISAINATNSKR